MWKEIGIIIGIIVIVVTVNFSVEKYLIDSSNEISNKLLVLEENAKSDKKDEVHNLANEIENDWQNMERYWSMLVIHQELDNIESSIIAVKAAFENDKIEEGLIELKKAESFLRHIGERDSFKLKNIF